jgi:hypothetical protein
LFESTFAGRNAQYHSLPKQFGADPEVGVQSEAAYANMTALEFSVSRRRRDCTAILKEHMGM